AGGELIRTTVLAQELRRATSCLALVPAPQGYAQQLPLRRVAAAGGLAALIASASPLIDRSVATSLHPGSVTIIDLGERVLQVPLTIISMSLVLVAGTYWASLLTSDVPTLRHHFRRTIARGVGVSILFASVLTF